MNAAPSSEAPSGSGRHAPPKRRSDMFCRDSAYFLPLPESTMRRRCFFSFVHMLTRGAVCAVVLVSLWGRGAEAQPVFDIVNRSSGLPSDYINDIYQDRFGFLWFSTDAGLARYDGQRVETFTADDGLPHPFVYSVLEDGEGTLWAGTFSGLARFDGTTLLGGCGAFWRPIDYRTSLGCRRAAGGSFGRPTGAVGRGPMASCGGEALHQMEHARRDGSLR